MPRGRPRRSEQAIASVEGEPVVFEETQAEAKSINELYASLSAPFDVTFQDTRGGAEIEYITGEQCIRRLNDCFGIDGWDFEIVKEEITSNDEVWVKGRLTAYINAKPVVKEQFGSQKIKLSRQSGKPLDIGFDLKGASTDALKKCASLLSVALYLSRKDDKPTSGTARAVRAEIDPGQVVIESEYDPLWQKYQAGRNKANELRLPASDLKLPVKTEALTTAIKTLAAMIKARENPVAE